MVLQLLFGLMELQNRHIMIIIIIIIIIVMFVSLSVFPPIIGGWVGPFFPSK